MTLPSDIGHDHTWSLRQRDRCGFFLFIGVELLIKKA